MKCSLYPANRFIWAFLAALATASTPAKADTPPYGAYLEPESGPYTLGAQESDFRNKYVAFFTGMPYLRKVQMVVDGPTPEAVFSDEGLQGGCQDAVTMIHVKLQPQPAYGISGGSLDSSWWGRQVTKARLDCSTFALVSELWEAMLTDVRYYPEARFVADGRLHHFSYARVGMLVKSGKAHEPAKNTIAGQFVLVGQQLATFIDAPEKEREAPRSSLSTTLLCCSRWLALAMRARLSPNCPRTEASRVASGATCLPAWDGHRRGTDDDDRSYPARRIACAVRIERG